MKRHLKFLNRFLIASVFTVPIHLCAQVTVASITPVLVGSTGNFSVAGGMMLSASTGEPMVPTWSAGNYICTQGFQQPSSNGSLSLTANVIYANVSCIGSGDGSATVTPSGGAAPYSYVWSNTPNDSSASVDSLQPGSYTVTVTDAGGLTVTQTFTIVEGTGICGIHVYSGLTPNGDGHNDDWIIDYLELFQPNNVMIYNRWGVLVWQGANYDNQNVVWKGTSQDGKALSDGTYYYVIEVGQQSMKGWVEVSH